MKKQSFIVTIDKDLEELIPDYLERRRSDIAAINEAIGAGDFGTAEVLGHSMKGSGGGYGFDRITDIGRTIEFAAKDKDSNQILKALTELTQYLDGLEIAYE